MSSFTGARTSVGGVRGEATPPTVARKRNYVRICSCGYSTPVTTAGTAAYAFRIHVCREKPAVELPRDLPAVAANAVAAYLDTRRNNTRLDVDSSLVQRFVAGEHSLPLNTLERVAVFALLRARGVPVNRLARVLHLSWASQRRYRTVLLEATV